MSFGSEGQNCTVSLLLTVVYLQAMSKQGRLYTDKRYAEGQ
jgi:hypothetical protein